MTRTHLVLATLCGSIALAGCMDSKPTPQEKVIIEPEMRGIAHRDTALTLDKKSRSGAAYVEGGYTHVLATRNDTKLNDRQSALVDPNDPKAIADEAKSLLDGQTKKRDASIYTSARWERFCGQGKMTADDWDFIADQGRDAIPANLKDSCIQPDYLRKEYFAAWMATDCETEADTQRYAMIRSQSITPNMACPTPLRVIDDKQASSMLDEKLFKPPHNRRVPTPKKVWGECGARRKDR